MLKVFSKVFCVLSFAVLPSFAFADTPSWYNGDERLYNLFVSSCKLLSNRCPINCNVKSLQEFEATHSAIASCRAKTIPSTSSQSKKSANSLFTVSTPTTSPKSTKGKRVQFGTTPAGVNHVRVRG